MRFRCIVVSLFLLPGFGFALSNVPDSVFNEPVVIERQLSGGPCTIRIQSAERLTIAIVISGIEIPIPAECLADLSDCNVPDGVQIADFAGEMYLLLSGGLDAEAWSAKFIFRNRRLAERHLVRGDSAPDVKRFLPEAPLSPPVSLLRRDAISTKISKPQPLPGGTLP
jgi:hypothetical protein